MKTPKELLFEMTGDKIEEDLRVSLSIDYSLEDIIKVMQKYADSKIVEFIEEFLPRFTFKIEDSLATSLNEACNTLNIT